MEQQPPQDDTEQTRREERLREEIVASVSAFNQDGYNNLEISKALIWSAFHMVQHEPFREHYYFMMFMRDSAQDGMDVVTALQMRGKMIEFEKPPSHINYDDVDTPETDRLRGKIVAFVSDLKEQGFDNFAVGRALVWSSYHVAEQEPPPVHYEFLQRVRDNAQEGLNIVVDMVQASLNVQEKMKIN